jgi:hypothetical protein
MPWLGTLLVATSAALGRLVAVNLLPTAVLAAVVGLTVRANAFSSRTRGLHWDALVAGFKVDSGGLLLFIVALFALAALLQPFEIATVRLLEGYWSEGRIGARAANLAAGPHRRRLRRAERNINEQQSMFDRKRHEEDRGGQCLLPVDEQVRRQREEARVRTRAAWSRRVRPKYPPVPGEVMPTMLGNVLRTAERRAGERYYLPTVPSLPRLHAQLSDRMAATYNAAVDTLDAAATISIAAGAAAVVAGAAFWDDPALRWVPVVLLGLSVLSYRGALVAAGQYGMFMDIAFDLHRFDLLKALHLNLPEDTAQEEELGERITAFLASRVVDDARNAWEGVRYWHYEEHARPSDTSAAIDGQRAE